MLYYQYESDYERPMTALDLDDQILLSKIFESFEKLTFPCFYTFAIFIFIFSSKPSSVEAKQPSTTIVITEGMFYDKEKSKTHLVPVINKKTGETFGWVRDYRSTKKVTSKLEQFINLGLRKGKARKLVKENEDERMKRIFAPYVDSNLLNIPKVEMDNKTSFDERLHTESFLSLPKSSLKISTIHHLPNSENEKMKKKLQFYKFLFNKKREERK